MATRSPMTTERVIVSSTDSRAWPAAFLFPPNRVASWSISCALFTVSPPETIGGTLVRPTTHDRPLPADTQSKRNGISHVSQGNTRERCPQTRCTGSATHHLSTMTMTRKAFASRRIGGLPLHFADGGRRIPRRRDPLRCLSRYRLCSKPRLRGADRIGATHTPRCPPRGEASSQCRQALPAAASARSR